ncbi:MAG: hypothetical protein NT007_17490 [Candidatus Kapabacteria bacterium]|nr:hypothetical protein [Candidatus Kapabacteria bacterium]
MRNKIILYLAILFFSLMSCVNLIFKQYHDDLDIIEKDSIYNESYKLALEIKKNYTRLYDLNYFYPAHIDENYLSREMKDISNLTKLYLFVHDTFSTFCGAKIVKVTKAGKLSYEYRYHISQKVDINDCYGIQFYNGKFMLIFWFININNKVYM